MTSVALRPAAALASGAARNVEQRRSRIVRFYWSILLWGMGAIPFLGALTTPRFFLANYALAPDTGEGSGLVGRLGLAMALALATVGIFFVVSRGRYERSGNMLWLAALCFSAGPIISGWFGSHPGWSVGLLGLPLTVTAIALPPSEDPEWLIRHLRVLLLSYAYGSLASALIAPSWAVEAPYVLSHIPGLHFRLHGLANHANNLAALMVGYLILEFFPTKARRTKHWRILNNACVLLVLLLTQSKTAWAALTVGVVAIAFARLTRLRGLRRYIALTLLALIASGAVAFAMISGVVGEDTASTILAENPDLATLTGRVAVWQATIDEWRQNPIFGYGPGLWNADMRAAYAASVGWTAPHAHNQVLQTLGEAGIVGVIGLALYLLAFSVAALRVPPPARGVAVALVVVLLVRGLTEPPLDTIVGTANFFVQIVTFALLLFLLRSGRRVADDKQPLAENSHL